MTAGRGFFSLYDLIAERIFLLLLFVVYKPVTSQSTSSLYHADAATGGRSIRYAEILKKNSCVIFYAESTPNAYSHGETRLAIFLFK
jgi:hypothetical protein